MKKGIVWAAAFCVLAGGGYWAFGKRGPGFALWNSGAADAAKKPARSTTATVTIRDINLAVTAAGDIGPLDAVSVRPEVGGIISKLTLDIGDKVKRGDILFELDDKELQTEKSSRQTEIAGARLAVETQKLQLEKSKLNFDRIKSLYEGKLVSQEVYDNARVDHDLVKNSVEIAANRLEASRTALQQVEDKLGKTVIRAPFDCTILTRPVSVGQAVSGSSGFNSGTEVFTVANLADMVITAHVNQADVTRLKVGQAVSVQVEAVPGLTLVGHVDRIAPQATFKNGIKGFSTRVMLKNAEGAVRPGMTANLSIPLVSAGNVVALPLAAVFNDQGERFVYLQKGDGSFERQAVQLGVADFDFAEVTKGLKGGEVVSLVTPGEGTPGQGAGSQAAKPKAPSK